MYYRIPPILIIHSFKIYIMKKNILFLGVLFLFSCTSVVYTHKQVMDEFKNKEQIIARFGLPASKMTEGEYEQWYYDYGTESRSSTSSTFTKPEVNNTVNINVNTNSNSGINWNNTAAVPKFNMGNSFGSTVTNTNNKFIKIIFKGDNVISWDSQSLNFAIRGRDRTKSALLLGPLGLLIK